MKSLARITAVLFAAASINALALAPRTNCPTDLLGDYEFPHLIIPVNSDHPNVAQGTSFFGDISPTNSTIFNFDIPSAAGKRCSLIFLLPEGGNYEFTGSGNVDICFLKDVANSLTTWNNKPQCKVDYGVTTLVRGGAYNIMTYDCPAGQTVSIQMESRGGTRLRYFQDSGPPIGLYIRKCEE